MADSQQPEQPPKRGRPTAFREEYIEQARKLCRLGAIDREMADFFGVTEQTINNWKNAYPEFRDALRDGKEYADAEVAHSLYLRANGYTHPDVHISRYQGEVTVTPFTKYYPPDTAACMFWLKNRRPDLWRDRRAEEEEGAPPEAKEFSYQVVDGRAKTDGDPD